MFLVSSLASSRAEATLAGLNPRLTSSSCSLAKLLSRTSLVDSILTRRNARLYGMFLQIKAGCELDGRRYDTTLQDFSWRVVWM